MSTMENALTERLLIEAAQNDPKRFAELYETHFDQVYAYIAKRTRNRDEAQDLTAEVFQRALANLPRFEWRGAPFAAWLVRIAANTLADRMGELARHSELPNSIEEAGVDTAIQRRAMLTKLIARLPADQRQVIIGRFIEDKSIRAIAAEMKRSEGAIKQLQFRALTNLRERIGNHYD
jgi:RNA polymerase sigma-70 factor, ECF subfamily